MQPLQRDPGADDVIKARRQALEMAGEYLIETVIVPLILDQGRPRQIVELLDAVRGDPLIQRLQQGQELGQRHRNVGLAQLEEKIGHHRRISSAPIHCRSWVRNRRRLTAQSFLRRLMNSSRSNRCTSCSFFSSAPYSGGIALR